MKTKTLLRKILSAGILLSLLVLIVISCKKKDDPTPPAPPPTPSVSPFSTLIDCKPPKFLTNNEIANHKTLPGYLISRSTKSLMGGFEDLEKIGDVLWEIHDYEHTEMEFAKIDKELTAIQSQLTGIKTELNEIAAELQLGIVNIENWITQQNVNVYMVNIYTLYADTTSQYSLMYFPAMAARIQRQDPSAISLTTLQEYESAYYTSNNNATVETWINNISNQIINEHALRVFTKQIILNNGTPTGAYNNPANLMNAYKLLEGFFMQMVNSQIQGMCIVANIDNRGDTTGLTWKNRLPGFQTMFQAELKEFYTQLDYLFINLYDYRNTNQFNLDAKNCTMGIAPDESLGDAKARARFIGNVILDGLGLPYNPVSGSIVIPYNYGFNGTISSISSLTIAGQNGGQTVNNSYPDGIESQYPNTILGAVNVCEVSNLWNIFEFGLNGDQQTGTYIFDIGNDNASNSPWAHSTFIKASYRVQYYNPENGNASSTKDSVHTMQFGYIPLIWWWGDLFQNFNTFTYCNSYPLYNTDGQWSYAWSPSIGVYDGDDYEGNLSYNFGLPNSFSLGYSGPMVGTEYTCVVFEAKFLDLQYVSIPAGCELFTFYQTDPPDYSTSSEDNFTVWAGTDFSQTPEQDNYYFSNSDIMFFSDSFSSTHTGSVSNVIKGESCSINVGFQWMDSDPTSSDSHQFNLYWCSQVIYLGISPLPE